MTRLRYPRSVLATVLALACVILPCAAWYVAGNARAEERITQMRDEPYVRAREEAGRLARLLASRLDALLRSESRRPFYDYARAGSFTLTSRHGQTPLDSPLAEGPADPLIWSHFRIDEVGLLSLPSGLSGRDDEESRSIQQAILEELECARAESFLYREPAGAEDRGRSVAGPDGLVTVGPFRWHVAAIADAPALIALREVRTADAVRSQGFVVRARELEGLLEPSSFPATIRHGEDTGRTSARIPVGVDPWSVRLDVDAAGLEAFAASRSVRTRFLVSFAVGSAVALLAAFFVVWLVYYSERLAQERSRFAAAAAHELRTPLAGLRLHGEMLSQRLIDPRRVREYGTRIVGEAERLTRVVHNVLEYTHLERGGTPPEPRRLELASVIRDSFARLSPALEASGAIPSLEITDAPLAVLADRDAVHRILQNLLDNAEKFGRNAEDRRIEVHLGRERDGPRSVVLRVVDHGRGIPFSLASRLFRPFVREDRPGGPPGLGLGLTLVRSQVDSIDAQIDHHPTPGGGTTFRVVFRAAS